ncbi:hypothetical protein MRX96_019847 [Rhipicephalus microplus]
MRSSKERTRTLLGDCDTFDSLDIVYPFPLLRIKWVYECWENSRSRCSPAVAFASNRFRTTGQAAAREHHPRESRRALLLRVTEIAEEIRRRVHPRGDDGSTSLHLVACSATESSV